MRVNSSGDSFERFKENYAKRHGINPENYKGVIEDAYHASHSLCGPYPEDSYRSVSEYERTAKRARGA